MLKNPDKTQLFSVLLQMASFISVGGGGGGGGETVPVDWGLVRNISLLLVLHTASLNTVISDSVNCA